MDREVSYVTRYSRYVWKKTSKFPKDISQIREEILYRCKGYGKNSKWILDNDFVVLK